MKELDIVNRLLVDIHNNIPNVVMLSSSDIDELKTHFETQKELTAFLQFLIRHAPNGAPK